MGIPVVSEIVELVLSNFQTLPDGTLAPLHHHMALIATHDGTLYATIIYPFTLLKIDPIP